MPAYGAALIRGQVEVLDFRSPVVNRFLERWLGGVHINIFANVVKSSDVFPLIACRMLECTSASCSCGELSQFVVPFLKFGR